MEPLVSVVIPSYNHARYIAEAIEGALNQTHRNLEVVVVDDGSTDDSLSIIDRYVGPRVRCVPQKNGGVSAARNLGVRLSGGELVAFLDSDDTWAPTKIARQVALMTDPRIGLVNCGIEFIDGKGASRGTTLDGLEGRILAAHALLRQKTIGPPSAALVRRSCLDVVGGFDPALSMSADWDLWRRIICRFEVAMVRAPLLKYRVHGLGMHHNVDLLERDMLYAFERMFADPLAVEVFALRRECYANLFVTLSGSYLHQRRWRKGLAWAIRSLGQRPDRLLMHTLSLPMRRIRRIGVGPPPA